MPADVRGGQTSGTLLVSASLPSSKIIYMCYHTQVFTWALWGANSGQHAYVACTLPTEPSFQPGDSYLRINNLKWKLKIRQMASEMDQVLRLFNIFRMPVIWTAVNQMCSSVALWSLVIKLKPPSVFLFPWQHSSYSIETAPRRPLWTCHGILIAPTSPKPPVKIKTGIRGWLELKFSF